MSSASRWSWPTRLEEVRHPRRPQGRQRSPSIPGEVMCVIGPSGSGKSTFLRCINHLEKIDAGRLFVDGELVGYRQTGRQDLRAQAARGGRTAAGHRDGVPALQPLPPPDRARRTSPRRRCQVKRGRQGAPPRNASEGAAGARRAAPTRPRRTPRSSPAGSSSAWRSPASLAMDPKLMLFDEPTSALDPELVGEVLDVMQRPRRERHDDDRGHPRDGLRARGRGPVVFMDEGVVVEEGEPREMIANPQHQRTQAFLSKVL